MRAFLELLRTFIARALLRDKARTILTIAGITLGVAVLVGVRLANQSALASFRAGTEAISGRTSLSISGLGPTFDELLLAELGWLREHGTASPVIDGRAFLADAPGSEDGIIVRVLGIDILRDRPIRDWELLRFAPLEDDEIDPDGEESTRAEVGSDEGRRDDESTSREILDLLIEPDSVLVPESLARERDLEIGDPLWVTIDDRRLELRVRGFLREEGPLRALGGQVLLMDIAGAQVAFGMLGRLHRIDLRLDGDATIDEARAAITARLPASLRVEEPGNEYRRVEGMIESFHFNLNALASLALLVGLYLVYDTARFSVVRRRGEIGRLRAAGATRRIILALFLGEALLLAIPGTILGCLVGRLLARLAVEATAGTVRTFWVADRALESAAELAIGPGELALAFGVALPLCLVAALLPAREATRVRPWEAIRVPAPPGFRTHIRAFAIAALFALLGTLATRLPPIRGFPIFGYVAALLFVLAGSSLVPVVLALAAMALQGLARLVPPLAPVGGIAAASLRGSLPRVSIAIAALASALAMTIAIAILIGSFRRTVVHWLEQALTADVYAKPATVHGSLAEGTISPEALAALREDPDIVALDPRYRLDIDFEGEAATLYARDLGVLHERGGIVFLAPENPARAVAEAARGDGVLLSETFARRHDLSVGDRVSLLTVEGPRELTVRGIFYDYATHRGVVLIDEDVWSALFATPERRGRPSDVAMWVREGADPEEVVARLRRRFSTDQPLYFRTNAGVLQSSLEIFDGTFAITRALQAIAVVVAALGIVSTLLTLLLERRRELGLLVQCGATPRQLRAVIVLESALLGAGSQAVGLILGPILAAVLVYGINLQSFGWTIQWHTPWMWLAQSTFFTVLATAVAGLFPAKRAIERARAGLIDGA